MQENITIARPYAEAAFETALAESTLSDWSDMLGTLSLIAKDTDMQSLVTNPSIEKSVILEIVMEIFGDQLSNQGCKNFIQILVDSGRLLQAPAIQRLFEQSRADAEGTANVDVYSAFPLEQSQQDEIAGTMEKRLGRKISITTHIDESLIGGVVIRSGDSVVDASIKGRLNSLANEFAD